MTCGCESVVVASFSSGSLKSVLCLLIPQLIDRLRLLKPAFCYLFNTYSIPGVTVYILLFYNYNLFQVIRGVPNHSSLTACFSLFKLQTRSTLQIGQGHSTCLESRNISVCFSYVYLDVQMYTCKSIDKWVFHASTFVPLLI